MAAIFRELFEFSNRQLKITRVYAPHLWKSVLIGSFLFTTVFFGGLILVIARAAARSQFRGSVVVAVHHLFAGCDEVLRSSCALSVVR